MSGKGQPSHGIVTSDAVHPHQRHVLLIALIVLIGAALVAAAAYYGVRYSRLAHRHTTASPASTSNTENIAPAKELALAQDQVSKATTAQEKALAYTQLGRAYYDNNQSQQAIGAYQTALEQAPAGGSSGSNAAATDAQGTILADLSVAYYRAGNTAQDIATLQQLIALYQQSGTDEEKALIPRYQQLIQQLQGAHQ